MFLIAAMIGLITYWRATRAADRFATITGKGYRPNRMDLGRWRWPVALLALVIVAVGFLLPMAILLWRSLIPFTATPSVAALELLTLESYAFVLNYPAVGQGLANSVIVAVAAGAIAVLLTTLACWFVLRTRMPGRRLLDLLMFLPIGIPGLVLGLALLWIYLGFIPVLYATLWVLILAHITRFMPYAMRFSTVSLTQVHPELEEASRASGGSMVQTMRRIVVPLIAPGLIAAFVFVFMASFRELSASFLLVNVGTRTIPTVVFELWDNTSAGPVAALGILVGAILVGVVIVARAVGLRLGIRQ
jgi:iron(III) transport system permease protein